MKYYLDDSQFSEFYSIKRKYYNENEIDASDFLDSFLNIFGKKNVLIFELKF